MERPDDVELVEKRPVMATIRLDVSGQRMGGQASRQAHVLAHADAVLPALDVFRTEDFVSPPLAAPGSLAIANP